MARKPAAKAAPKKAVAKKTERKKVSKPGQKPVGVAAAGEAPDAPVMKMPPKGFIKKFVTVTLASLEVEKNSAVGDIGSAISVATEKQHVEKRALAIVRRLHKLSDKKFQETWFHLNEYYEQMGFQARADKQGQLELRQAEPDAQTDIEDAVAEIEAAAAPRKSRMRVVPAPDASVADAMHDAIKNDGGEAEPDKIAAMH